MIGVPTIPLALALLGVHEPAGLRAQVKWAAALRDDGATDPEHGERFRAVQLNAAAADCRPRDLGRSARRDLGALLRRSELACAGVDLFIPPGHLGDPANADRALGALLDAIDFAQEMSSLAGGAGVLATTLPDAADGKGLIGAALDALRERASARGVRIADVRWPARGDTEPAGSPVGIGIDCGQVLLAEGDPALEISRAGGRLASLRAGDASGSGERLTLGEKGGRLDTLGVMVAAVTAGYSGFAVVDVRGARDKFRATQAASAALGAWRMG